ncbi:MAG: GDP-mannose 4,6-dehydratase [Candidatus Muiribacterium halophilum]|uniref:GDP-mannose 4,6-dehydratase n=1 Tax=Muiribacterium halophilum TaxID=2053465 RepID=A0A2N5Z9V2_MUIH1|nr:MAG: GDP-mannose 4,6-dehydratase [Candidatus Muirbacterium halophilum]
MKKALITGITGQDGAYLAKFLIEKGYKVYGGFRRTSTVNFWRLEYLKIKDNPQLELVEFDLLDQGNIYRVIESIRPQEIYNLAAQSFVGVSFKQPTLTAQTTGVGVLNILECIREIDKNIRFYQASTSELFGKVREMPQKETTPFHPRSPYGVSKLFAHWTTINYRESYGIFACCGILFNHESPLRGKEFVTRKITDAVSRIKLGKQECLEIGNLNVKRDWGYAKEYVEAIYQMLQHKTPEEFVIATGKSHTIREFIEAAFECAQMKITWKGEDVDEVGVDSNGVVRVKINPKFFRPAEVNTLLGDPKKSKEILKWESKTDMKQLCDIMMRADMARNQG